MSNRNIKFELPALKGTELWPRQIQAPPIIRIESAYVGRSQITATQQADNRYVVYNQWNAPTQQRSSRTLTIDVNNTLIQRAADLSVASKDGLISNFALTQRRNFSLSPNGFSSTHRDYGDIKLHYTNLDNSFEIITAHVTVTEQNIVDYVSQQETIEEKREEADDTLMVVVFHGGNTVSYAPMSALNQTAGRAARRTFGQSSWGSDIIKTCQLPLGPDPEDESPPSGAIYSEFADVTTGIFRRSSQFNLTTTSLEDTIPITSSDARHDYPIMNVSEQGDKIYLSGETVRVDEDWRITDYQIETAPVSQSGEYYKAFAISRTGERYYAGAYTTPSLGGSAIFIADNLTNKEIYDVTSIGPAPFLPSNPYQAGDEDIEAQRPSIVVSAGYYHNGWNLKGEDTTQSFPNPNGYLAIEYSYNQPIPVMICDEQKPGIVDVKLLPASGYYYDADPRSIITYRVANTIGSFTSSYDYTFALSSDTNDLAIVSYVHFLFPFGTTNWFGVSQYISHLSLSGYYSNRSVTCYFQTEYERIDTTPYLHEIGHPYLDPTPYFDVTLYRGWLHVANHDHVLQGFMFDDKKYLYLDNQPVPSLLGVSIEDIQTVLFDIPLSQINQFK